MRTAWLTMIRNLLIIIFIAVLMAGCLSGESAEKGTLHLSSTPAGAEIYLDNEYRGTAPATISGIDPGSHTLEFRMKGYKSWKSAITVVPGDANYVAAMSVLAASEPETGITPVATEEPVALTLQVSRDQLIVGDSVLFSGIATGTGTVSLTLFGPGIYEKGVVLDRVRPGAGGIWSFTWNPGSKIRPGTYTILAESERKTASVRKEFTAIGNGIVSVSPSSYAIAKGETVILSGRCTTNAPSVRVVLFGPERFGSGVELGSFSVKGDQTWSYRFVTDLTMPTGIYTVYVSDVPKTTSGTAQFTLGFAS
ncbi:MULTISPECIES: PEGA domain-containing protein [unclassified Methanoregula]|uniref:PEGA domain-containing protein n=1 Tax=unclassified Methanoregula TaxID=2649730 RepID=UPI0009D28A7D|nr:MULTISPECIES: PEGA domain-containing protein [unclassified Methanoregula]OPX63265.1 MAG: PEGA domain protein [Methanoregula sp. PtaB.Bin085]OPY34989.1 MAG: PEGA domain protein [Methanoregula sp. PtaU1.Bin006]